MSVATLLFLSAVVAAFGVFIVVIGGVAIWSNQGDEEN